MELALGRFPLDAECKSLTILELLQHIVNEPLPRLPRGEFPEDFCNFVDICLAKNVESRPSPDMLAVSLTRRMKILEMMIIELANLTSLSRALSLFHFHFRIETRILPSSRKGNSGHGALGQPSAQIDDTKTNTHTFR